MANKQYIGARYVPRFMGEYDATTKYEGLDVVDNGLGTSYIARKPVPVGTPLTDTTYWAVYGASSGAIINLQNQIDDINSDISDLPTIRTNISNLQAYEKKHRNVAVYIGNSYAQGVGSTSGTDGIFKLTKSMFNEAYLYADGGAGFLGYTGHTTTFRTLLTNAIADSAFDNDDVSDIIFLCAWGESQAYKNRGGSVTFGTDLLAELRQVRTLIDANFPDNVRVTIAFVEGRSHWNVSGTAEGTSYLNEPFIAAQWLRTLSPRAGFEYLGWLSWEIFMNGTGNYSADGYHPNDTGYINISSIFKTAYNGAYVPNPRFTRVPNAKCDITSGSTIEVHFIVYPDHCTVRLGKVTVAAGNTPAQYSNIDIAELFGAADTTLIPVKTYTEDIQLGNLVIDAIDTKADLAAFIRGDSEGKIIIKGITFDAQTSVSAQANGSAAYQFDIPYNVSTY